jgi:hypothetical protein
MYPEPPVIRYRTARILSWLTGQCLRAIAHQSRDCGKTADFRKISRNYAENCNLFGLVVLVSPDRLKLALRSADMEP